MILEDKVIPNMSQKCMHCGKERKLHLVRTRHCPLGKPTRAGIISYHRSQIFKPNDIAENILRIKKSNWPYYKKSTVCRFAALKHEMFEEWKEAIEYIKLVIHYEKLFEFPIEIEIKGWEKRLKKIQKKRNKNEN